MFWLTTAFAWTPIAPGDLPNALSNASPGDILVLEQGTHTGPFTVGAVTLVGDPNRTADVVLTGGSIVVATTGDAVLADLVVQGGPGVRPLLAPAGTTLTLDDVEVRDGDPGSNGGALSADQAVLIRSRFVDNTAPSGGHAYVTGPSQVFGSQFEQGTATGDGGALATDAELTVYDAIFTGNSSGAEGGGIWVRTFNAGLILDSSRFENNMAAEGGAVFAMPGNDPASIRDSRFIGNHASVAGGALVLDGTFTSVQYASFCTNTAPRGSAADIGWTDIRFSTFQSNIASDTAAVFQDSNVVDFEGLLFQANSATNPPDALWVGADLSATLHRSAFVGHSGTALGFADPGAFDNENVLMWANGTNSNPAIGAIEGDPVLQGTGCDHPGELSLGPGSAALDVDPTLLDGDGSIRDIGPTGGPTFIPCPFDIIGYRDLDGDGFGDPDAAYPGCHLPPGYVVDATDCDDLDPLLGEPQLFFVDADGDGHGDPDSSQFACTAGSGSTVLGDDCDDANSARAPSLPELLCNALDDDCDNGTPDIVDADADGVNCLLDCNDADPDINPNEVDATCDGIDQDCDNSDGADLDRDGDGACTDCNDADPDRASTFDETRCDGLDNDCDTGTPDDPDGDGDSSPFCEDCNDADPARFPGNTEEQCNAIDDDCDTGTPDDDGDADGDGVPLGCGDCDDSNPDVPAATEICNGIDDDCDGEVDEDLTLVPYWPDADQDGYGDGAQAQIDTCGAPPPGYVNDGTDCNDEDSTIHPGATDLEGNGIDEDCSGFDGAVTDADGDGVAPPDDCNDADPTIAPGLQEDLSDVDRDCDGFADPTGRVVTTCGCRTPSSPASGMMSALLLAVACLVRRRPCGS